jgi:hypothetical protein
MLVTVLPDVVGQAQVDPAFGSCIHVLTVPRQVDLVSGIATPVIGALVTQTGKTGTATDSTGKKGPDPSERASDERL